MKLSQTFRTTFFLIVFCILFLPTLIVFGKVGVGVGAGEVRLTEPVHPGGIYTMPALRIFNTGDERTTYKMNVAFHQDHLELRPKLDWFIFDPMVFTLNGGESQEIGISMTVPVTAEPGDYFAFIESGPTTATASSSGTSVGVAVATKLFFYVEPANLWKGIIYRVTSFLEIYSPWSYVGLAVMLFAIFVALFARFFSFNVALKKKDHA